MIRVVVADDQSVVREGLVLLLGLLPGIQVVGSAPDGEASLVLVDSERPDVVLMDLRMPRMDGVEATRRIRSAYPDTQVVVLTTYSDDESVFAALRAGARGFLTKDADADEIAKALATVTRGDAQLDPKVQRRLLDTIDHTPNASTYAPGPAHNPGPALDPHPAPAPGPGPGPDLPSRAAAFPHSPANLPDSPVRGAAPPDGPARGAGLPADPARSAKLPGSPASLPDSPARGAGLPNGPAQGAYLPDGPARTPGLPDGAGRTAGLPDGLTRREAEVLALIADGLSNAEIAARLHIAETTVKTHINNLFAKARLRDRAQAVTYAFRHRLAHPG